MPSIFFSMFGCVLPSKVYIADEQHRESSDAKEMSTKPSKEEKAKDNKDVIDSGRLTFDSGKIKVDEDPFPKTANINMVVITLLDEGARDDPCLEGQLLTKKVMRSVQK
ncbi:hypothetical protein Droror1_Dr00015983 [Drosera rotundifolia]